jgi:hypothetical protein
MRDGEVIMTTDFEAVTRISVAETLAKECGFLNTAKALMELREREVKRLRNQLSMEAAEN